MTGDLEERVEALEDFKEKILDDRNTYRSEVIQPTFEELREVRDDACEERAELRVSVEILQRHSANSKRNRSASSGSPTERLAVRRSQTSSTRVGPSTHSVSATQIYTNAVSTATGVRDYPRVASRLSDCCFVSRSISAPSIIERICSIDWS